MVGCLDGIRETEYLGEKNPWVSRTLPKEASAFSSTFPLLLQTLEGLVGQEDVAASALHLPNMDSNTWWCSVFKISHPLEQEAKGKDYSSQAQHICFVY